MANSNQVVVELVKAIMAEEGGPLSKFLKCKDALLAAKVGYYSTLDVDTMMVHPANRGGLGINHFNAHQVGFKIHKLGADMSQLKQACCMEMHPPGAARDQEVACNQGLVDKSAGMLAPVNGQERYVSLSTGHTAAFCKAAKGRCVTNISAIADAAGRIDLNLLSSSSSNFALMVGRGWSWFCVPYWVGDEVPGFPHLAQQALNASHSVANQATEIEVAASIAEAIASQGPNINWKRAIAAAAASEPPCVEYIDTVGQYVKLYGGGGSAQLIHFLSGFAKQYGESLKLGQEFMKAITELAIPSNDSIFVHLRTAVLATQLTTGKVVDGIAKLITRADVNSFKTKPMQAQVEQVEAMLDTAWKEQQHVQASKPYGLLCIRCVLFLTKKAKWGIDTTEYATLDHIFAAYQAEKDLPTALGSASTPTASGSASSSDAPATLAEASNPLWIAMQRFSVPLVVGNTYVNHTEHAGKLFELMKLDIDGASFVEHNVLKPVGSHLAVECKLGELKKWVEYKGKLQKLISRTDQSGSDHTQLELDRCEVYADLCQLAWEQEPAAEDLLYTINPSELFAGRDFKKGELKLVPFTDVVSKITGSASGSKVAVEVSVGTNVVWVQPPTLAKDEIAIGAPYWWVKSTPVLDAANMVECKLSRGVITHQCLTNSKAIKKFTKIMKMDGPLLQPMKKAKVTR
jgi:hypothetical protein